jgi:hypothetical protein
MTARRLAAAARAATLLAVAAVVAAGSGEDVAAAAKAGRTATYVYAHAGAAPNVVIGFRWERDGTLTPLAGSPFATGLAGAGCTGNCQTLGASAKRKALVVAGGGATVGVLLVAKDGTLAPGPNSPFQLPGGTGITIGVGAVDRGARTFVYANAFANDRIHGLALAKDGTLAALAGSPWTTGDAPDGIAATKRHVFSVNDNERTISAFAVGADGALAAPEGSPFPTGANFAFNLHADLAGKRLYVGDANDGDVVVHAIDRRTAALARLPGDPVRFDSGNAGSGIAFLTKSLAVVVPSSGAGDAQSARVAKDGSVAPLGGAQDLGFGTLTAHGRSPNGRFLVVADGTSLRTFSVDKSSGALTAVDQAPMGRPAQGLRVVVR